MNRLGLETSPYLKQHQNNPVDWFPWSEEAFAAAKSANGGTDSADNYNFTGHGKLLWG